MGNRGNPWCFGPAMRGSSDPRNEKGPSGEGPHLYCFSAPEGTRTPNLLIRNWIHPCHRHNPLMPDGHLCRSSVGDP